MFFALVLSVLVFVNIPGQIVLSPEISSNGQYGPDFDLAEYCEHGWPLVYMRREGGTLNPPSWRFSLWNVFEGVKRFNTLSLILNALIGFVIALTAASLFEIWRRRRNRLLQFHLRDMLILTGLLSVLGAILVFQRSQHMAEQTMLQAIDKTEDPIIEWNSTIYDRIEWQPGGPSWLRQIVGDRPFQSLDRVAQIEGSGIDLEYVVQLRQVRMIRMVGRVSNRQLEMLEDLPHLEAMDMLLAQLDDEGPASVDEDGYELEYDIRLPHLPQLRGLNLYGRAFRGVGLQNIPSIEVLDLTNTEIDDDSLPALSTLTNLKSLSLQNTHISDKGLKQLRHALPDCEILK